MSFRTLKKEVLKLLTRDDFASILPRFSDLPARKAVNPLFSFLYSTDDTVRWHAVSAMGMVTAGLAEMDRESARIVMRRLIWNLNDESGGIGWGSPEAMGDIMARSQGMAREFYKILVSYILPHGNFLEHETLQRGVLWGLHRLAEVAPLLTQDATPFVRLFLSSKDPYHRGLAACYAGGAQDEEALPSLKKLVQDKTMITTYSHLKVKQCRIRDLTEAAISRIEQRQPPMCPT